MREENYSLSKSLQHPRRSLGNRHRSQAQKFLSIIEQDQTNLHWAEQSARQSVLYDFTNEENWKTLIRVKVLLGDTEGARAVLEDLFSVLGRAPNLMEQLANIEIIDACEEMLLAVLLADPLDPDKWWQKIGSERDGLRDFGNRLRDLDFSDRRSDLLFSRRLERIRRFGDEDAFVDLSRYLLSQRPQNHEAWEELGRMYEKRGGFDEAWLCYDQAQTVFPESKSRDRFRERMANTVDGGSGAPWKGPSISERGDFLDRLRRLSDSDDSDDSIGKMDDDEIEPYSKIDDLRREGKIPEAFFLARRLAMEGSKKAEEIVAELLGELNE